MFFDPIILREGNKYYIMYSDKGISRDIEGVVQKIDYLHITIQEEEEDILEGEDGIKTIQVDTISVIERA